MNDAPRTDVAHPAPRLRSSRFLFAVFLVGVLSVHLWGTAPVASMQVCGSCPETCGYSECSCGICSCGSAEFCSIAGSADFCLYGTGCPAGETYCDGCCITLGSPILIDVSGNGLDLSNVASGVLFPLGPANVMYRVAWTEPGSDDGWLVLDRNGNGVIDNGQELFGNYTPQPAPAAGTDKNGYLALAVYDQPSEGGNGDGWITPADTIYSPLRIWQDGNHDGVSDAAEMNTLPSLGITGLALDYRTAKRVDEFGNMYRYRAKVRGSTGQPWSVDVFLKQVRF